MNATGGPTFTANNSVDLGNNTGWIINTATPQNLYWVDGSGNWNDSIHWSFTSGGTGGACLPTAIDNIFFDSNSFLPGSNNVNINVGDAICKNMDWTGATNNPSISGSTINNLRIYGSLTLISDMSWGFQGEIFFESTSSGKTVTSAGQTFNNYLYFQGVGGGWILSDDLTCSNRIFLTNCTNGSFNTSGHNVSCLQFNASADNISLTIANSTIQCNWSSYNGWQLGGNNITFDATNSLIILEPGSYFSSSPAVYHNIQFNGTSWHTFNTSSSTFNKIISNDFMDVFGDNNTIDSLICYDGLQLRGANNINTLLIYELGKLFEGGNSIGNATFFDNGEIYGNNTFDTLILSPGKFYLLQSNKIQTINLLLDISGNGCFPITLHSTQSGTQATIAKSSDTVSCDYIEMRDQNATGGGTFYAGDHSTNVSNNTGWSFSNAPGYSFGLGSDTSFCQGDTLLLTTANFNGGISWLWQDGSTDSIYYVTQPGTYWVQVTYAVSCFIIDTINISVNQIPLASASSNSPVCLNDTIKLFGDGGTSYSWSGPDGFTSTLQNPTISNASLSNTGDYFLSVTQNGCESLPDTVYVQVASSFSVDVTINASSNPVQAGTSVIFSATPLNGGPLPIFQWFVNNNPVGSDTTTYEYTPLNGDEVKCVLTSSLSCAVDNPDTSNVIIMVVEYGTPCSGTPTVTYESKTYNTVQIGTQCWLKENLDVGIMVNGTQNQTDNDTIEKYCYNNSVSNCNTYGGLYQWDEIMQYDTTPGSQGICPDGWHIPTDNEWKILEGTVDSLYGVGDPEWELMNQRGFDAGKNLKDILDWSDGVDLFGFSALHTGNRHYTLLNFHNLDDTGFYWSSDESDPDVAYDRWIHDGFDEIGRFLPNKGMGFAVRCLKDTCSTITSANAGSDQISIIGTSTTLAGNSPLSWETGEWSIASGIGGNITLPSSPTSNFAGLEGNSYELVWTITNNCNHISRDTVTISFNLPCPGVPTVDYDGKTYNTIQIGAQCWLKENLDVGVRINSGNSSSNNMIIEKYCYNDIEDSCIIYGGLYLWDEMMQYTTTSGLQGICPITWHIPTDSEWMILADFLGGQNTAGGKLKETGTSHWQSPNTGATNESGFTGLPGGSWTEMFLTYHVINTRGYFWTSSQVNVNSAWNYNLAHHTILNNRAESSKLDATSVRCLKDYCSTYDTVEVTISPSTNPVCEGDTVTFTASTLYGGNIPCFKWFVNGSPVINASGCPPTDGLIAYFPFSGNAIDATGNGNNGTVTGPVLTSDRFETDSAAYLFDGINDEISVNVTDTLEGYSAGDHTYSVWIKLTTTNSVNKFIIDAAIPSGPGGDQRGIRMYPDQKPVFKWVTFTGSASAVSPSSLDISLWYHLAGVLSGNTGNLYINGSEVASSTSSGILAPISIMKIGQVSEGGTGDGSFPGVIDEVKIYNRALTEPEIQQLFAQGDSTYSYAPVTEDTIVCILTSSDSCVTNNPDTSNLIVMTVNTLLPVSVTIVASDDTVCAGDTVIFTATPVNGGSAPVYQWKVNGINQGTNSPVYEYEPEDGDLVTCMLTSNATCPSGNPASSNTITIKVNPIPNTNGIWHN